MIRMFYKACRIITWILVAFIAVVLLSKFLPVLHNVFEAVSEKISSIVSSAKSLARKIDL